MYITLRMKGFSTQNSHSLWFVILRVEIAVMLEYFKHVSNITFWLSIYNHIFYAEIVEENRYWLKKCF